MAIANASLTESVGSLLNKVNETIVVVNDLTDGTINTDNIVADTIVIDTAQANAILIDTLNANSNITTANVTASTRVTAQNITANSTVSGTFVQASSNVISSSSMYSFGSIRANENISANGGIVFGQGLRSTQDIQAGTTLGVGTSLTVGGRVWANTVGLAISANSGIVTGSILRASANLYSSGDLYVGDDIFCMSDIQLKGSLYANTGRVYTDFLNATVNTNFSRIYTTGESVLVGRVDTFDDITTSNNITSNNSITTGVTAAKALVIQRSEYDLSTANNYRQGIIFVDNSQGFADPTDALTGNAGGQPTWQRVQPVYDLELDNSIATYDIDITKYFTFDGLTTLADLQNSGLGSYTWHGWVRMSAIWLADFDALSAGTTTFHQVTKRDHITLYFNDSTTRTGGTNAWVRAQTLLNDAGYTSDATNLPIGTTGNNYALNVSGISVLYRITNHLQRASFPNMRLYVTLSLDFDLV